MRLLHLNFAVSRCSLFLFSGAWLRGWLCMFLKEPSSLHHMSFSKQFLLWKFHDHLPKSPRTNKKQMILHHQECTNCIHKYSLSAYLKFHMQLFFQGNKVINISTWESIYRKAISWKNKAQVRFCNPIYFQLTYFSFLGRSRGFVELILLLFTN